MIVTLGLFMTNDSQSWTKVALYVAGLLACVAALLLACGPKEHEPSQQKWEQKIAGLKASLITRYHPIEFPPRDFTERKVFTCNLQELLVGQDGKPFLFDGFLDDITKDGKEFAVHFTSRLSYDASDDRTVRFHLKCEYGDVKSLIENPPKYRRVSKYLFQKGIQKDFLVVCLVTDVKKIVNYSVIGRTREGSEDVELDVKSPDTFSVQGKLLQMVKYSDVLLDKEKRHP
ncbi:MAG: hypothetical protein AMK69_16160 [Nitrospira bacterium SG8_3]|nr:MAG: hypothetical protein AMK69_16160 [Nitrospira bacterium SG8_3]